MKKRIFALSLIILITVIAIQVGHAYNFSYVEDQDQKKAVFILPFEKGFPLHTRETITRYLQNNGYEIDIYRDENVTVELMKNIFLDYDIIIFKTFKDDHEQTFAVLTGEKINKSSTQYDEDISEGRINTGYGYTYELTEDFFDYYYTTNSLENKLMFLLAPKSIFLFKVLQSKGASTIVGYNKDVSLAWGWCDLIAEYFFRYLSFGYNAGESIEIIKRRLSPANAYTYSNLALTLSGDKSFVL